MVTLETTIYDYLRFCESQKKLDDKSIKAYRIDLKQFRTHIPVPFPHLITQEMLEMFISMLHQTYKPKTAKRKIATVKSYFRYLEYKDLIKTNPFTKIQTKFREPVTLPKIIPLHLIETLLYYII